MTLMKKAENDLHNFIQEYVKESRLENAQVFFRGHVNATLIRSTSESSKVDFEILIFYNPLEVTYSAIGSSYLSTNDRAEPERYIQKMNKIALIAKGLELSLRDRMCPFFVADKEVSS